MTLAGTHETVHNGFMSAEPRISARCTSEQEKRGIEDAAALMGLTTSKFILMHVREAAAAVLRKHGRPVPFLDLPSKQEVNSANRREPDKSGDTPV